MGFEYLTNVPLAKAREEYIALLVKNGMAPSSETIHVRESSGRVTAGAVYARISSPHYNASAMDGIALDASLTFGATETTPVFLKKDQFAVVDTGDPLPPGADAVVMVEDVIEEGDGVLLYQSASPWQHIGRSARHLCRRAASPRLPRSALRRSAPARRRVRRSPSSRSRSSASYRRATRSCRPPPTLGKARSPNSTVDLFGHASPVGRGDRRLSDCAGRAVLIKTPSHRPSTRATSCCSTPLVGRTRGLQRRGHPRGRKRFVPRLAIKPGKPAILGLSGE